MSIRHFRTHIHFCAFVGFATMSSSSMHGHGSFRTSSVCSGHLELLAYVHFTHICTFGHSRQSVSNCNTTSCLYLIRRRYIATAQPMYVQRNIEACSCSHCCNGKAMCVTQPACEAQVCSRQCSCTILSSVACPGPQYFSIISHKRHDFRKKKRY